MVFVGLIQMRTKVVPLENAPWARRHICRSANDSQLWRSPRGETFRLQSENFVVLRAVETFHRAGINAEQRGAREQISSAMKT